MNFLATHELVISTLSPVHIGCGEDYEPTNYVIDDKGVLHALEASALARAGGEPLMADLARALEIDDAIRQLRAVHAALQRHRDKLAPAAVAQVPMCKGVLAHYRQTQDARNDFNRNGIERTTFNPITQHPYLPGSSLKGAMRTAWLWQRGAGHNPLPQQLLDEIARFNDMIEEYELGGGKIGLRLKTIHSRRDYGTARKDIERALQSAANALDAQWLGGRFETDPLRALKIGDAQALDADIEREIRFCLNRSRSGRRTQAQSSNLYTRLEYICEHQPAAFGLAINLQRLESIAGRTDRQGKSLAPMREQLIDWQDLVRACNNYYLPRLENDLRVVRILKPNSQWAFHTAKLLDEGLRDQIGKGEVLLLRVGKHGGADSNTVDGRQIKIMLNEDRRQNNGREEKIRLYVFDSAPRTSWYCGDDLDSPSDLMPHGWVVISRPGLAWQEHMAGHERRMERHRLAEAAQRRQAEEAEKAKQEAERAAARAAALAAMTPNQRLIADFIATCQKRAEQLNGGKDKPNTTLHNKAREMVKAAKESADWTQEEKQRLADAIEEWLPKLIERLDAKETRKQLKLAELRSAG